MAEFDHKGSDIISECRHCHSIGSLVDGLKDVVGPIVALTDVRSNFVLVRECSSLRGL
jgi:cytochrome c2